MAITYFVGGIKVDGSLWMWGANTCGQLGNQTVNSYSSPVAVVGSHSFERFTMGGYTTTSGQTFALKANGTVWAWGYNLSGQLGTNNTTSYSSPVQVVGNHIFSTIRASETFTIAMKSNGTLWSWGQNTGGQLGTNNTTSYSSPVAVVGNHTFVQISTGYNNSATAGLEFVLALKDDGTAWAWGGNGSGQLGTNNIANYSSPVQVVGNHSFIQIVCGSLTAYGIKADGSVWSWGANDSGQAGNNASGVSYSSPVAVVGSHSFQKIAAGYLSTYGLKGDGSVWSWGVNASGALADLTATSRSSPVPVVGSHSFVEISTMRRSVIALKPDSSLWAWGYDGYGQLGNNYYSTSSALDFSSPVQVVGNHLFMQIHEQPIIDFWGIDLSPEV
jgi:alpha-tubulin suppressor-like RCC1 family protein